MTEINSKKWWLSKTIWAGALEIVAGIFTAIAADLLTGTTLTVSGILTIALRVITNSKLIK